MNDYFDAFAARSIQQHPAADGDFVDPESGLLICGVCGEPKRSRIDPLGRGAVEVNRACRCVRDREESEKAQKRRESANRRRREAFGGDQTRRFGFTFGADDGQNADAFAKLRRYCDGFTDYRKTGAGLLLYSQRNGGGKTFGACAVANRLIDEGYRVLVTDLPALRDGFFAASDRTAFLRELCDRWALIVLDDLGAEGGTEATTEAVFRIVDTLTDAGVPLVATTNFTPKELTEHPDRAKRRIYDRILGGCVPIKIDPPTGQSRRIETCRRLMQDFESLSGTGG